MTIKEKATALRDELKKLGYNNRKISIKSGYCGYSDYIDITIKFEVEGNPSFYRWYWTPYTIFYRLLLGSTNTDVIKIKIITFFILIISRLIYFNGLMCYFFNKNSILIKNIIYICSHKE